MITRVSGAARRVRAVLDARPVDAASETDDIILTVPDPKGRGWLHLTGSDLRDLLAENERLRMQNSELFTENLELQYGPTASDESPEMTDYWNDTFDERLEEAYAEDVTVLTGRVVITTRITAAELQGLPRTDYVKAYVEYGNPDDGYVVAIVPGDQPPLSTMSVADEVRALVEALPDRQFEGVLTRQAPARRGGAFSTITASGRTVRF